MSWAKIDDHLAHHPKIVRAGNEAVGVWIRAISWCTAHETDGEIARETLEGLTGTARFATCIRQLLLAGLLHKTGRDKYAIHDFLEWNPSAKESQEYRDHISKVRSEAGRIGGLKSASSKSSKTSKKGSKKGSNLLGKQTSPVPSRPKEEALLVAKQDPESTALFSADLLAELRK